MQSNVVPSGNLSCSAVRECLRRACRGLGSVWRSGPGEGSRPAADASEDGVRGADGARAPQREAAPSSAVHAAKWAFEARHEDELSFKEGDLFQVSSSSGDWWQVRRIDADGSVSESGTVPGTHLARAGSVELQPWYFGKMKRFEAQCNLMAPGNEDGAFLVRHSEKHGVGLVLSVKSSNQVRNFKIFETNDGEFRVQQGLTFSCVLDLVEHYSSHSLSSIGRLGRPCRRIKPNPPDLSHYTADEWELPKEEFTLEKELGSGHFADVYRGRWKNHISVAIKVIRDSELNHGDFLREIQILKRLRHRHLISLLAVCTASAPYYIITELMENGSLLCFLRGPEGQLQDVPSLIDMGAQVADGMSYLEEHNSVHRDLAARNVLVGEHGVCKVADFGLARVMKESFYMAEDKKIPYKWSAPEAISHGRFSVKSDVWSFGILLYEIITYGGVPYPGFSNQEVHQQLSRGYRMPSPDNCPEFLYNIMLRCWSAEPEDRPDFKMLTVQLEDS
ncbi:protein-tyrosine kinase 6b [Betta splendens]|uniref:Tyrosine-protein kinase n=1 Tax=Betta splendens TaxID=158456 RepID=A0A6P7N2A0_BETSP|nr:protein-tyrosine kinase 6b [Betta splendens]XP_029012039.1 protein-tyrosine kinase 6b [Betta splendens]